MKIKKIEIHSILALIGEEWRRKELLISPSFLALHSTPERKLLYYRDSDNEGCLVLDFSIENGVVTAKSPAIGPIGGLYWKNAPTYAQILSFYECVIQELSRSSKASELVVRLPPDYSNHDSGLQAMALVSLRASVSVVDISYHLTCRHANESSFFDGMSRGNQRAFKRLTDKGYLSEVAGVEALGQVYDLIVRNRQQMGYAAPMPLALLTSQVERHTESYSFFKTLTPEGVLCAASIVMKFNKDVAYVQYWGDTMEARLGGNSPIVHLACKLYTTLGKDGWQYISLGTSSQANRPLEGVAAFKLRLGAQASKVLTFRIFI